MQFPSTVQPLGTGDPKSRYKERSIERLESGRPFGFRCIGHAECDHFHCAGECIGASRRESGESFAKRTNGGHLALQFSVVC